MCIFSFAFLFIPHITYASGLQRTPSNLGLIGYWSFNEGTSTIATDFSGNGVNLTLSNFSSPPTQTSGWTNGALGKALAFDGLNDIASVSSNTFADNPINMTVSAWVKTSVVSGGTYRTIVSKNNNPAADSGWRLAFNSGASTDGSFGFYIQDAGNVNFNESYTVGGYNDGKWHHVVVTVSGGLSGTVLIYVDGVNATAGNYPSASNNSTSSAVPVSIGDDGTGYREQITIDEVRIYNRALSATEISNLYRSGAVTKKGVTNSGLVGYWPLNEGFGTVDGSVVGDVSGNNNYGTTSNFATPSTATSGWSKGRNGYALNFDGVNDHININDSSTLNLGAQTTFAAWIKLAEYPSAGKQYITQILGDESTSVTNCGSTIWRIGSQGSITYQKRIGINFRTPTDHDDQNNTDLPLNTWVHIAVTTDGANSRYYINGVLDTTNAYTVVPQQSSCTWGIGWNSDVGRHFSGSISDVRLYNRTLSSAEIAAIANQSYSRVNVTDTTTVTDGLVANWTFDGKYMDWNANQALDVSSNSLSGTLINISTTTSPTAGKRGQALIFNGTNSYVNVPSNSLLDLSAAVSISAWVNPSALQDGVIVDRNVTASERYELRADRGNNGFYQVFCVGNANSVQVNSTTLMSATLNTWVHLVGTCDSNGSKIYVNGVLESSSISAGVLSSQSGFPLHIGGDQTNAGPYFKGAIDEVRLYNRALSASEVLQLYNSAK